MSLAHILVKYNMLLKTDSKSFFLNLLFQNLFVKYQILHFQQILYFTDLFLNIIAHEADTKKSLSQKRIKITSPEAVCYYNSILK